MDAATRRACVVVVVRVGRRGRRDMMVVVVGEQASKFRAGTLLIDSSKGKERAGTFLAATSTSTLALPTIRAHYCDDDYKLSAFPRLENLYNR